MVYVDAVLSGVKTGREDIYIDLTDFIFGGGFGFMAVMNRGTGSSRT